MDQNALSVCLKELLKISKNYKLCSFVLEMSLVHPDIATCRSEAGD